jgi:hypothetical protein
MADDYDVPVPEVVSGVPDFPETAQIVRNLQLFRE